MFPCLPKRKHFFRVSRQSSAYNFIVWKCDHCNKHQYLTKAKFYPTYHSKYEPLALTWNYTIDQYVGGMTVDQAKAAFARAAEELKAIYHDEELRRDREQAERWYAHNRLRHPSRPTVQKKERWYRRLWKWLDENLPM